MIGTFKVAHLIGITRDHEAVFRDAEKFLTKIGYICFAPAIYNYDEYMIHKEMIDDMCTAKFNICDIVVVVTPEHIGKSTTGRIKDAMEKKIPVFTFVNNAIVPFDCHGWL